MTFAHNHSANTNPNDNTFEFHTHDICEIIFLKSGNVSAIIGEKHHKLQKGSLIIFRANIPHRIRIDGPGVYERHNVLFNENILANGIFNKLPKEIDLINCGEDSTVGTLFDKIDYYYNNFSGEDLKVLVINIIEEILFNMYLNPVEKLNETQILVHPVIKNAVEYINAHYTENISIEEISKDLCVTKTHFGLYPVRIY